MVSKSHGHSATETNGLMRTISAGFTTFSTKIKTFVSRVSSVECELCSSLSSGSSVGCELCSSLSSGSSVECELCSSLSSGSSWKQCELCSSLSSGSSVVSTVFLSVQWQQYRQYTVSTVYDAPKSPRKSRLSPDLLNAVPKEKQFPPPPMTWIVELSELSNVETPVETGPQSSWSESSTSTSQPKSSLKCPIFLTYRQGILHPQVSDIPDLQARHTPPSSKAYSTLKCLIFLTYRQGILHASARSNVNNADPWLTPSEGVNTPEKDQTPIDHRRRVAVPRQHDDVQLVPDFFREVEAPHVTQGGQVLA
uniref:Uncharacterized protein n=1 Tax=Timema bartmani TaxID=61472 RepID=A0A7R9I750_9NEOP|nr:unnamed protein product [Timema bartmani]